MSFNIRIIIVWILSLLIVSCSDSEDPIRTETKGWSVEKIYNEANSALEKGKYSRAEKLYLILEYTYPYGGYAQKSLLDLAYTYYQDDKPELALPTLDQFISTYPTSSSMDYALYLKGYINYKNDNGLLSRFSGQDLSERDPKSVLEAYKAFTSLVTKFPSSRYAPDARDKINRLINAMSRGELYKARYYMSVNAYLAAISRSQNVITGYPNTAYVEEALAIQILAYRNLGEEKLSQDTKEVLRLNFPRSKYLTSDWQHKDIPWFAFWQTTQ